MFDGTGAISNNIYTNDLISNQAFAFACVSVELKIEMKRLKW